MSNTPEKPITTLESGASITYRMISPSGIEKQFTYRGALASMMPKILEISEEQDAVRLEAGWTTHGKAIPQAAQIQQPQAQQSNGNGYANGNGQSGEYDEYDATTLTVEFSPKNGEKVGKVKGPGKYAKFGVRLWPEVAEAFGVDLSKLGAGDHEFKHHVRVQLRDGKAQKVIAPNGFSPQSNGHAAKSDTVEFPHDPLAKSMADLVTVKQLGLMRATASEVGVDIEEECQSVLQCLPEELSKRAASSFIDHLKSLEGKSTARGSAGEPDFAASEPANIDDEIPF